MGRVFLRNLTRDVQWRFNANRWLATDEGDKKIEVELAPSKDEGADGMVRQSLPNCIHVWYVREAHNCVTQWRVFFVEI